MSHSIAVKGMGGNALLWSECYGVISAIMQALLIWCYGNNIAIRAIKNPW